VRAGSGCCAGVMHSNAVASDLHLIARDFGFMFGEIVCVAAVLFDMRKHSRQCGRPLLTVYPNFIAKVIFMCAFMWSLLSFTTFSEEHV
jgi:hypothetical protein